jgi:general secretion pathway protein H
MRIKGGFTLIEILMVLVIISITLSFSLLAFGDFGANRRILMAAEQFSSYLKLIQQQAILEGKSFGININNKGYKTYRLEQGKRWQAMPEKGVFHWQYFPGSLMIDLHSTLKNNPQRPDIVISSTGDLTAFKLNFSTANNSL